MPRVGPIAAVLLCASLLFTASTADAKKPKMIKVSYLKLEPSEQSPNTQNGVTVAADYAASTDPRYYFEYRTGETNLLGTPKTKRTNVFAGTIVVDLAITNNTGHVLRTNGAVVSLTPGDGSEPIQAYSLKDLAEAWAASGVPGVGEWMKTQKIRLIDLDKDVILPGQTLKGVLPFKANVQGVGTCAFSILDLVTQTDAAGNPTERTNFTFNFKEAMNEVAEMK